MESIVRSLLIACCFVASAPAATWQLKNRAGDYTDELLRLPVEVPGLTDMKLKSFKATIIDDGKVMGKVRLRYEFDGVAGLSDDIPAYAEIDVTVPPGRPFAMIDERHEMSRLSAWEFEPTVSWKATRGLRHRYNLEEMPLKPGRIKYQPRELISNLVPRWNQNGARDTFFMSAADDKSFVGALTILMGRWYFPHDNSIKCLVKESADSITFRCPTMRGIRYWLLVAGDPVLVTGKEIEEPDPRNKNKMRKRHVGGLQPEPASALQGDREVGGGTNP